MIKVTLSGKTLTELKTNLTTFVKSLDGTGPVTVNFGALEPKIVAKHLAENKVTETVVTEGNADAPEEDAVGEDSPAPRTGKTNSALKKTSVSPKSTAKAALPSRKEVLEALTAVGDKFGKATGDKKGGMKLMLQLIQRVNPAAKSISDLDADSGEWTQVIELCEETMALDG